MIALHNADFIQFLSYSLQHNFGPKKPDVAIVERWGISGFGEKL